MINIRRVSVKKYARAEGVLNERKRPLPSMITKETFLARGGVGILLRCGEA